MLKPTTKLSRSRARMKRASESQTIGIGMNSSRSELSHIEKKPSDESTIDTEAAERKAQYIQRMAERRRSEGLKKAHDVRKSIQHVAVGIPQSYLDAIANKPDGIYHTGINHPVYKAYYLGIYLGEYSNEFQPKYLLQKLHRLSQLLGLENTALTAKELLFIAEEQEQHHVVTELKELLGNLGSHGTHLELDGVESRIDVEPNGQDYIVKHNNIYHGLVTEAKAEMLYSSLLRLNKQD